MANQASPAAEQPTRQQHTRRRLRGHAAGVPVQQHAGKKAGKPLPQSLPQQAGAKPGRICRFWANGHCRQGNACRFVHDTCIGKTAGSQYATATTAAAASELPSGRRVGRVVSTETAAHVPPGPQLQETAALEGTPHVPPGPQLDQPDRPTARPPQRGTVARPLGVTTVAAEIAALWRRYPAQFTVDESAGARHLSFTVKPSDPQWPAFLNILSFTVQVLLSPQYPREPPLISVQGSCIPEEIATYVDEQLERYVANQRQRQPSPGSFFALRDYLRWLDHSLEALFLQAMRQKKNQRDAARLSFIPAPKAAPPRPLTGCAAEVTEESALHAPFALHKPSRAEKDAPVSLETVRQAARMDQPAARAAAPASALSCQPERQGIEIALNALTLTNIGLLQTRILAISFRCERCKGVLSLELPQNQSVVTDCPRCHTVVSALLRTALVHANTNVLGFLDMSPGVVLSLDVNLAMSQFSVECAHCQHPGPIALQTNQMTRARCRGCHQEMTVQLAHVKVKRVGAAPAVDLVAAPARKRPGKWRHPMEQLIHPGQPLPDQGACVHYRKSRRWLRFPCCGIPFPCDVCHDKQSDHPCEWADRGYCAVEQRIT